MEEICLNAIFLGWQLTNFIYVFTFWQFSWQPINMFPLVCEKSCVCADEVAQKKNPLYFLIIDTFFHVTTKCLLCISCFK